MIAICGVSAIIGASAFDFCYLSVVGGDVSSHAFRFVHVVIGAVVGRSANLLAVFGAKHKFTKIRATINWTEIDGHLPH